ncbi:MAG TPA: hypothetical protein VIE13_02840 [Terriglobales bacterium]|jgi:hypothetical protein
MVPRKKTADQELIEEARRLSAAGTEAERHKFVLALEEMARLGPFDANRI